MVAQPKPEAQWVLLSYRVPREPSTPRIAIWRRLKRHGVVQVGDGLVALPFDARTKEHLEWVASMVYEADGDAIVWVATTTKRQSDDLARRLNEERDAEYGDLLREVAVEGATVNARTLGRLRREFRRIDRRDYLRAPLRDKARLAIADLSPDQASDRADEEADAR